MSDLDTTAEQAAVKRVCSEHGCPTLLSRYNDGEWCSLHQPMIIPRMRGKVLD